MNAPRHKPPALKPPKPSRAPQRKGFGYQVLTMIAPRAVNGSAELEFTNGGMRWTLWKPSVAIAAVA